ncbi:proteophosphoglycan ppg4 [Strigomonas culicis]|uniref:Proteophosphoglycan ppg4 n=1 Tax=Strigomonas culicis TaxID=28005 RepID=S9TF33_9TRYP|nr:proteophosphoglycan ppg4 [Strigomonas culicis]|eukprot:EPY16647.1 proteophosphoglycan ppg4 [Strigomonas culicis]
MAPPDHHSSVTGRNAVTWGREKAPTEAQAGAADAGGATVFRMAYPQCASTQKTQQHEPKRRKRATGDGSAATSRRRPSHEQAPWGPYNQPDEPIFSSTKQYKATRRKRTTLLGRLLSRIESHHKSNKEHLLPSPPQTLGAAQRHSRSRDLAEDAGASPGRPHREDTDRKPEQRGAGGGSARPIMEKPELPRPEEETDEGDSLSSPVEASASLSHRRKGSMLARTQSISKIREEWDADDHPNEEAGDRRSPPKRHTSILRRILSSSKSKASKKDTPNDSLEGDAAPRAPPTRTVSMLARSWWDPSAMDAIGSPPDERQPHEGGSSQPKRKASILGRMPSNSNSKLSVLRGAEGGPQEETNDPEPPRTTSILGRARSNSNSALNVPKKAEGNVTEAARPWTQGRANSYYHYRGNPHQAFLGARAFSGRLSSSLASGRTDRSASVPSLPLSTGTGNTSLTAGGPNRPRNPALATSESTPCFAGPSIFNAARSPPNADNRGPSNVDGSAIRKRMSCIRLIAPGEEDGMVPCGPSMPQRNGTLPPLNPMTDGIHGMNTGCIVATHSSAIL